jgi:hypothetical protein
MVLNFDRDSRKDPRLSSGLTPSAFRTCEVSALLVEQAEPVEVANPFMSRLSTSASPSTRSNRK